MYVFRESHRVAPAGRLLADLADAVRRAAFPSDQDEMLDALLRAGELECSLADSGQHWAATQVAGVTDCLASALVHADRLAVADSCSQILNAIELTGDVTVKTPEGFAYYGLHPLDYARLVDQQLANSPSAPAAAVIGIRTIGTTLSAIVAAEVRKHRIAASRVTVRPHGHPFRRECRFSGEQREWIAERRRSGAQFIVVDEGPGLSGSSFFSVANALQMEGIDSENIVFYCSRMPEIASFCTETSREQWPRFQAFAAIASSMPEGLEEVSYGKLRERMTVPSPELPASWTQMERRKFFSRDGAEVLKFEGHGKYGDAAFDRARKLADAGFGPQVLGRVDGFTRYEWLQGRALVSADFDEAIAECIAQYCAFRQKEFQTEADSRDEVDLAAMTRVNLLEEFGEESAMDLSQLRSANKVITDSRMMPHAWVRAADGKILKTNGGLHGDDHFFPGPCDIAWDLAGAIVEWEMGDCVGNQFLQSYARLSGDDAKSRMPAFLTAYAAFRMGYCKMAAGAMKGSNEEARLRQEYLRYKIYLSAKPAEPELARAA